MPSSAGRVPARRRFSTFCWPNPRERGRARGWRSSRTEKSLSHLTPITSRFWPARAGADENGRLHRYAYEFEHALKDALRTDYELIAVGELRDEKSARTLLNALNTGVRGSASTWHADSLVDGLYRFGDLLRSGGFVPPRRMIARFVDALVFMTMTEDRRRAVGGVAFNIGVDGADDYCMESVAA